MYIGDEAISAKEDSTVSDSDQDDDETFQSETAEALTISEEAQANLERQIANLCTAFEHSKLRKEAGRNWDRFYNRHGVKFFKVCACSIFLTSINNYNNVSSLTINCSVTTLTRIYIMNTHFLIVFKFIPPGLGLKFWRSVHLLV